MIGLFYGKIGQEISKFYSVDSYFIHSRYPILKSQNSKQHTPIITSYPDHQKKRYVSTRD